MQLLTIDLSTGPFIDERLTLPGSFRRFAIVRADGDLNFRFQQSDDAILMSNRGDRYDLGCDPEGRDVLVGSVRVTGEAGSGTVVLACSVGELPDFKGSTGSGAGISREVIAHYVPKFFGPDLSTAYRDIVNLKGVNSVLSQFAQVGGSIQTWNWDGVSGTRLKIASTGTVQHYQIMIGERQLTSLYNLIFDSAFPRVQQDWEMRYEDDILWRSAENDITPADAGSRPFSRFGIGGLASQSAAGSYIPFFGFVVDNSSPFVQACMRSGLSTYLKTPLEGFPLDQVYRLGLSWGRENGEAFFRLLSAGEVIHDFTIPLVNPMYTGDVFLATNMCGIQYGVLADTNGDEAEIIYLAGQGGILSYSEG